MSDPSIIGNSNLPYLDLGDGSYKNIPENCHFEGSVQVNGASHLGYFSESGRCVPSTPVTGASATWNPVDFKVTVINSASTPCSLTPLTGPNMANRYRNLFKQCRTGDWFEAKIINEHATGTIRIVHAASAAVFGSGVRGATLTGVALQGFNVLVKFTAAQPDVEIGSETCEIYVS